MLTVFDRVRHALADRYDVLRESGSGGMGLVFVARDPALDRNVAIKVLRPELATAVAAERFLAEARILARLNHPNVVTVHDVGEADGLFFYVMEYLEVPTLAARLADGPLPAKSALKLGRDLLDGLEAAHAAGIVHRDIKPANIFLAADRALLSDFGIAADHRESAAADRAGPHIGTPAYMAPEQAVGGAVTAGTDLHASGMVIYEAYCGRRWSILTAAEKAEWSGVPRSVVPVLRRALAWSPQDRWPDAASFRRALWRTRTRPYVRRTIGLAAAGLITGLVGPYVVPHPPVPSISLEPSDLAILPFEVETDADSTLSTDLAHLVVLNLRTFPHPTLAEERHVFRWWRNADRRTTAQPDVVRHALQTKNIVSGTILGANDSLEVRLTLWDSTGRPVPGQYVVRGTRSDPVTLGDAVTRAVLSGFAPQLLPGYESAIGPGTLDLGAFREFMLGEAAFRANDWRRAIRHYEEADSLDPDLALAQWHSWNAWGWLLLEVPYQRPDLATLLERRGNQLSELDRRLIEAQLTPAGPRRFALYDKIQRDYPRDAWTALLYGNDLVSRGALFGVETSEAIARLEKAIARDPSLSPAHALLALTFIRLGEQEAAHQALDRLHETAAPDSDIPGLLDLAFVERFEPDQASAMLAQYFPAQSQGSLERLVYAVRWPLYFELPQTQIELGRILTERAGPTRPALAASGHTAQGLALLESGRTREALAHFDSAAAIEAGPETRLLSAEWRVLLALLQLPDLPKPAELGRARETLEELSAEPGVATRAAWALGLDAALRGDTAEVAEWRERIIALPPDSASGRLARMLAAVQTAVRGDRRSALRATDDLRSEYVLPRNEDPLARAVLHMLRANWWLETGEPLQAEREWRWTENLDVVGYPTGAVQAAEVDWALGAWAGYRRGMSAMQRNANEMTCRQLERVTALWSSATAPFDKLSRTAADSIAQRCHS